MNESSKHEQMLGTVMAVLAGFVGWHQFDAQHAGLKPVVGQALGLLVTAAVLFVLFLFRWQDGQPAITRNWPMIGAVAMYYIIGIEMLILHIFL